MSAVTTVTREALRETAASELDRGPGWFRLTGLPHDTVEAAGRVALEVSAMLGRLLPQDGDGTLLREVTDRGVRLGEGRTGRYSDSRQGGSLHTDAPHMPAPIPDCFALLCVHQAPVGGDLCLVPVAALLDRLPSPVLNELRGEFHFDRRDATASEPTVTRPVLQRHGGGERMHYLREYIEIGHAHPGVPALTPRQGDALDALDALLEDPTLQQRVRLQPGEMIFINNRTLLHGRTAFTDDAGAAAHKRLMLRTWILRG